MPLSVQILPILILQSNTEALEKTLEVYKDPRMEVLPIMKNNKKVSSQIFVFRGEMSPIIARMGAFERFKEWSQSKSARERC